MLIPVENLPLIPRVSPGDFARGYPGDPQAIPGDSPILSKIRQLDYLFSTIYIGNEFSKHMSYIKVIILKEQ